MSGVTVVNWFVVGALALGAAGVFIIVRDSDRRTSGVLVGIACVLLAAVVAFLMRPTGARNAAVRMSHDSDAVVAVHQGASGVHSNAKVARRTRKGVGDSGSLGATTASSPQWAKKAFVSVGLLAFLALTHAFLDADRRDRYTWPIRIGSAAAFFMLCVVLWRMGPLM